MEGFKGNVLFHRDMKILGLGEQRKSELEWQKT